MTMKRTAAVITCLVIAFALGGCDIDNSGITVAGVEYYHFDTDNFYSDCDKLESIASTDNSRDILNLYDKLYSDCEKLSSLYSVIYIKYSENVANEYYSKEQVYSSDALRECSDRFCGICHLLTEGDSSEAFRKHVGDDAFIFFSDYDAMKGEEKKLSRRENKLVDQYYKTIDSASALTVEYKDKNWTLDELMSDSGEMLAISDYEAYSAIYDKLMKMINRRTGSIFIELVDIRDRIAELNGYESYADFEDVEGFHRDYSREELKKLYSDVQSISEEYYESRYSDYAVADSSFPEMSGEELLDSLKKYSGKVSKSAGAAADKMINEKLYSIGGGSCRIEGAFTTYIENAKAPFLFMTTDNSRDFATITHEFGHFTEYNVERSDDAVIEISNTDLAEIASNGFECLMTHYYDNIFRENSDSAEMYVIDEILANVVDGCVMDQFQREVYDHPDMTLEEINKTYFNVAGKYMPYEDDISGYEWVFVNHNFEVPMYYISYTVSALASLQIWNQSLTDFEKACKTWNDIIETGTMNKQYLDVIEESGLLKFTEDDAVKKICRPALKRIRPAADAVN